MAGKEALIIIPEDREEITAGETIDIQLVNSTAYSPYFIRNFYSVN